MKEKKLPTKLNINSNLQDADLQELINEIARVIKMQGDKINEIIQYLESE